MRTISKGGPMAALKRNAASARQERNSIAVAGRISAPRR
jgi:hypothetical protein